MVWAVDQGADVVSMSLGGDADDGSHPLSQAVNELSAASDTLVRHRRRQRRRRRVRPRSRSPGSADAALTVGAVDVHDVMAGFSSRGPRLRDGALKPEVVAPGVDVTAARAAGTELGPRRRRRLHHDQRHLHGHAARGRPRRHPQAGAPHLGRRAAEVGHREQHRPGRERDRLRRRHRPGRRPRTPSTRTCSRPPRCRWAPSRGPTPTSRRRAPTLTYTNTGAAPVTLSLALKGEDGAAEPTGSMTLAATQVTVPATGPPRVAGRPRPHDRRPRRLLGRRHRDTGRRRRHGAHRRRLPARARAVRRQGHHQAARGLAQRLATSWASAASASRGSSSSARSTPRRTRRAPRSGCRRATYATGAISFGLAARTGRARASSPTTRPSPCRRTPRSCSTRTTARRFDYAVDKPVVDDGAILDVGWNGDAGYTGFTFYGQPDRVYAQPSEGLTGGSRDDRGQLAAQPARGAHQRPRVERRCPCDRSLHLAAASPRHRWPRWTARYRIVDAGSATKPLTAKAVKGAVAVVSGTCGDLTDAAASLRKAGAAAMVAYAGDGQRCAGTVEGTPGLPALQGRPVDVRRLLANGSTTRPGSPPTPARATCTTSCATGRTACPPAATVDGTGTSVSRPRRALQRHGQHQRRRRPRRSRSWSAGCPSAAASRTSGWCAGCRSPPP